VKDSGRLQRATITRVLEALRCARSWVRVAKPMPI
jgi:hypothetical protein